MNNGSAYVNKILYVNTNFHTIYIRAEIISLTLGGM